MKFAEKSTVSMERSQEQIRATLRRYGAGRFGLLEDPQGESAVMFEIKGLTVRIGVPMPERKDCAKTPSGRERRSQTVVEAHYEQAVRQRWRALLLAIKAKLEAVESGISSVEREFMPFVVMPDGRILADHILPKLEMMSVDGKMPKLLTCGT